MNKPLWSDERISDVVREMAERRGYMPLARMYEAMCAMRNDYEQRIAELERAAAEPSMEQMLVEIDAVTGDVDVVSNGGDWWVQWSEIGCGFATHEHPTPTAAVREAWERICGKERGDE